MINDFNKTLNNTLFSFERGTYYTDARNKLRIQWKCLSYYCGAWHYRATVSTGLRPTRLDVIEAFEG